MIESKRERRGHFRGKPRPGRRVAVRFRVVKDEGLSEEQRAFTKNIGVGGAFILTSTPPPPGTALELSLEVPETSRCIDVRAEVRWILDVSSGSPEPGMGLKFNGLDVDQLLALNEYFASLTSTVDHDEG